MRSKMTGGRFIAESFKGYGITHVFFVEIILLQTLLEMEALGIKRILTHSEKAAAYMADGYARVKRSPGICMCQSVGAANLASGLQDPYLGHSPVIALTGRQDFVAQYRNAYQEVLHDPLFDSVTKYNVRVDTVEQLPYLFRQAFREATSGSPGPVHIDLLGLRGQMIEDAEVELEVSVEKPFLRYPSRRPEPEIESVKEAVKLLERADKPVIVAGGGATASSAGPEIVKLAEMLSIPVATSLAGKETILENHPLNVGVVGRYSRWCANRIVSESDLVLFIGSSTGDLVTNGWKIPKIGTPVIQIDINSAELGRSYPNMVGLMGDAKVTIQRIKEFLKPQKSAGEWARYAQKIVKEWRDEVEPLRTSNASPIRPERLCKEITEFLPTNGVLVVDTGYSAIWTGTMFHLTHPDQRYIRCAGSLGWGFPASLGVKCGMPDRPVVCFTGDGGFWYHFAELETARRNNIKTVTVVNNNSAFRQCLDTINMVYGEKPSNKDEICKFSDISFARIAEEMGCLGIRVEQPRDISKALKKALAANVPSVVEVVTGMEYGAPKPWGPKS
jgi:acetolactate synthase-1/2/3 large subunit